MNVSFGRQLMAAIGIQPLTHLTSGVRNKIANCVPNLTVKNQKVIKTIDWIGEKISSPQNRLILGVSALMSQPFIDLNNKKVDEETRKVSAARTVAKIIAGTLTGFTIRYACIKSINAFTKLPSEITENMKWKKLRTLLTPKYLLDKSADELNQYKNTLGTYISLGVMLFTNFLIDAPLTKYLTNKFIDKIKEKENIKNSISNTTSNINSKTKEVING